MSISHWPMSERPREKLIRQGPASLSDAELLAIFLRTGCQGKSAVDLARDLISTFGGLRPLLEADHPTFCSAKGLGSAKFAQLQAVMEIARRHLAESISGQNLLDHSHSVKRYLTARLRHYRREVFAVMFLDAQNRLLAFEEMFHGSLTSAAVYPREIVSRALHHNAASVIFAHNHPSGLCQPSVSDHELTSALARALETVDVRTLDHLVVGDSVYSFAEHGHIR